MRQTTKVLTALVATLGFVLGARANVIVRKTEIIPQDAYQDVDDLHFKTHIPEGDKNAFEIISYTITVSDFPNKIETPWSWPNGNGKTHGVTVDCDGAIISFLDYVTVDVEFELNNPGNTIQITNLYYTIQKKSVATRFPAHGFKVTVLGEEEQPVYLFFNLDTVSIIVHDFRYALNQAEMTADELWEWDGWTDSIPEFTTNPFDTFFIELDKMEPGKFLHARYDIYVNDTLAAKVVDSHQEPVDEGIDEDASSPNTELFIAVLGSRIEICYRLLQDSPTELSVYSVEGSKVVTLTDEYELGGVHTVTWDGTDSRGMHVPAGVYFCRLSAGGVQVSEKMIVIR